MTLFLIVLLAALTFEYINGFHDTANAIATVVSTKVLSPRAAVMWAAFWNLIGALVGTAVAKTIFTVPEHDIYYECIASSTNSDPGDAAKGATTDAITKIASWIGIGIDVYKGKHGAAPKPANANLLDLNDKLGLVPAYDDLTAATLKADFLKLVQKLPADQQERFMKDLDQMTPARFEKGIQFIQNQLSKK